MFKKIAEKLWASAVDYTGAVISGLLCTGATAMVVYVAPAGFWQDLLFSPLLRVALAAGGIGILAAAVPTEWQYQKDKRAGMGYRALRMWASDGCHWSPGKILPDRGITHLSFRGFATNVSDVEITLPQVYVKIGRSRYKGMPAVRERDGQLFDSRHPVETDKQPYELSALITVEPPMGINDKAIHASVIFVDQFRNEHVIKDVSFEDAMMNSRAAAQSRKTFPEEAVHAITNASEKAVATALKTELTRYKASGRREGSLGSVFCIIGGKRTGISANDWRRVGETANQEFVADNESQVLSDIAESIIAYSKKFMSEPDKAAIVPALLARLKRDSEYQSVGYMILLILFRLGHLQTALAKAKADLLGDDAYAFSDFLRLLDTLLKVERRSFDDRGLDVAEEFVRSFGPGEAFRIRERIHAIRAERLHK